MQNTGKIITFGSIGILAVGAFLFSMWSYKICWNCSGDDYFMRGSEYVCEEKKSYRQTGLDFLRKSAERGHIQAELTLAELYCNVLPDGYTKSASEQKSCLQQDVTANQEKGLAYFKSVLEAVNNGKDTDIITLNNLALLYTKGFIRTDAQGDNTEWLYEKAAAIGSFQAMSLLGNLYHENRQYEKALQYFIQASENSTDFQSPLRVGDYYLYGKGTTVDYQKAHNWYSKALTRTKKSTTDKGKDRRQVKKISRARLDMVEHKLEDPDNNRQEIPIHYSLEGGVKHFIIFAAAHSEESIGEVLNDNGNIYATINENPGFSDLLLESRQDNFSSMNEGLQWVLNSFAKNIHQNSTEIFFNFVLTTP